MRVSLCCQWSIPKLVWYYSIKIKWVLRKVDEISVTEVDIPVTAYDPSGNVADLKDNWKPERHFPINAYFMTLYAGTKHQCYADFIRMIWKY